MRRLPLLLLLHSLRTCSGDSARPPTLPAPAAPPHTGTSGTTGTTGTSGSTGRQIELTEGATARGGLILWMPLTVVLPSLAARSEYQYTAPARSQRRLHTDEQYDGNAQDPSQYRTAYDWASPEYRAAGTVGPLLSRLDAYFHYLRVPDEACRRRTICELTQQVEAMEPVSGLVLRALRDGDSDSASPVSSAQGRAAVDRFSRYRTAAARGLFGGDCAHLYSSCEASARQLVSMPALQLWQWLAQRLALHISDD